MLNYNFVGKNLKCSRDNIKDEKYNDPRAIVEVFKGYYSSKIEGLDDFNDRQLITLRDKVFKATFQKIIDYRTDLEKLEDTYISLGGTEGDFNIKTLFNLHFIEPKFNSKIYLIRDIITNEQNRLAIRLKKWLFSYGNINKEKLWFDERPITFLKIIDEINYTLYKRKKTVN